MNEWPTDLQDQPVIREQVITRPAKVTVLVHVGGEVAPIPFIASTVSLQTLLKIENKIIELCYYSVLHYVGHGIV
jgi:hypothetical protein